jgi:hypothetical protein
MGAGRSRQDPGGSLRHGGDEPSRPPRRKSCSMCKAVLAGRSSVRKSVESTAGAAPRTSLTWSPSLIISTCRCQGHGASSCGQGHASREPSRSLLFQATPGRLAQAPSLGDRARPAVKTSGQPPSHLSAPTLGMMCSILAAPRKASRNFWRQPLSSQLSCSTPNESGARTQGNLGFPAARASLKMARARRHETSERQVHVPLLRKCRWRRPLFPQTPPNPWSGRPSDGWAETSTLLRPTARATKTHQDTCGAARGGGVRRASPQAPGRGKQGGIWRGACRARPRSRIHGHRCTPS